jgi:hypothetical protein
MVGIKFGVSLLQEYSDEANLTEERHYALNHAT